MIDIKIKGLKKAVGDYQKANAGGIYDMRYGFLMYDKETGELWVDEFYNIGHNNYKRYESSAIINLGERMKDLDIEITMNNVKEFIRKEL